MGNESRKEKRELSELDRVIRDFYTGVISAEQFVEIYWHDTWEALIAYVQQSGFNMRKGKIPQALIDKKEEYEQVLIAYYRNPYRQISMEIGNRYFNNVDRQDIEMCIKYLVDTEQISSKSMDETICQYLSGKIPEIQEKPISKSIPIKDVPSVPDWYIPWKKAPYINRIVRRFYNGEFTAQTFVRKFSGTWEEFLDTLVEVGKIKSKDDISQEVLDKKEQFETAVIEYFGDEYCEMTQLLINGQYIHPTREDINEAIKFMKQNGIAIGTSKIKQTLTKYLNGEIEVKQEPEELQHLTGREEQRELSGESKIDLNVLQIHDDGTQILNEDLDALPIEELQRILETEREKNMAKESELEAIKKAQLLREIRAEQQKGKILQEQINAIKDNMSRGEMK